MKVLVGFQLVLIASILNCSGSAQLSRGSTQNDSQTRVVLDENQDTVVVETYREGKFEGLFKSFYPGNKLNVEAYYKENKLEGWVKRYYITGELMEEVFFEENEENGPFKEYFKNGALKAKGAYKEGPYEHGPLVIYDSLGAVLRRMDCNMGRCFTVKE
jgi:antitoxin component YwqK of YwqJK toxin-antitoxin module